MALTSQSSGMFEPNATGAGQYPVILFAPGSIKSPVYANPTRQTSAGQPVYSKIADVGTATNSQVWADLSSITSKYRVTSAHLEIHYIGNDENNGGEFIVNKFKPVPSGPNNNNTLWDHVANLPKDRDDKSPDTQFIPAKRGVEVLFFRNDRSTYQAFSNLQDDDAEAKMEAALVWLDGAATSAETAQKWRWTLTQQIEIVFKPDNFFSKFHVHSPVGSDEWEHFYDFTVQRIEQTGADICPHGEQQGQLYRAASDAYSYVPSLSSTMSGVYNVGAGALNMGYNLGYYTASAAVTGAGVVAALHRAHDELLPRFNDPYDRHHRIR